MNKRLIRNIGELLAEMMAGQAIRFDGRIQVVDADVATAFTTRELEHVKAQTYDIKRVALKARQFIPISYEANPGAEVISYDQWDSFGEAEIADTYSKDSPRVDAEKQNFPTKVFGLRASYGYSVQDLRAIAMTGSRLNVARAMQARRAIEAKLDTIAAVGVPPMGKTGFVNDANVDLHTEAFAWTFATAAQTIYRELSSVVATLVDQANLIEEPDTILLPPKAFQVISQVTFGVDNERSVLKAFLSESPYIKQIDQWTKLAGAGVGGVDRMVVYRRDPAVVELEIPQEYEEFPPEVRGLQFITESHLRTAGTVIRYPLAMRYADGTYSTETTP